MTDTRPLVLAMTGASGAGYAVRLLECLLHARVPVQLVVSSAAEEVIRTELGLTLRGSMEFDPQDFGLSGERPWWADLSPQPPTPLHRVPAEETVDKPVSVEMFAEKDLLSPIASGSHLTRGMVVCPCSGSTLAAIAHAVGTNLIHRAAEVHLKERRPLVLVPRETPLSTPMLENMSALSRYGATVLPASPGWYHGVSNLFDLIDFVVARILDQFQIPHHLMRRWGSDASPDAES